MQDFSRVVLKYKSSSVTGTPNFKPPNSGDVPYTQMYPGRCIDTDFAPVRF